MSDLTRIGVAIASNLLSRFDRLIAKQGYTNRSEAFRALIRYWPVGVAVSTACLLGVKHARNTKKPAAKHWPMASRECH